MINIVRAKGGKQRRLPLDVITLAELRDYVAKRTIASDAPLPYIPAAGPETGEAVWNVIGKHVHPHSFSHSFAINIVRHGVDIRRLQQGWDTRR
jgi:site-specific recombinase XerD